MKCLKTSCWIDLNHIHSSKKKKSWKFKHQYVNKRQKVHLGLGFQNAYRLCVCVCKKINKDRW